MRNINWENYTAKVDGEDLVFSNGERISYFHDQECCESVYVSWKDADEILFMLTFSGEPKIQFKKNAGIRVNECFVPCYDQQNGYYSSDLRLIFSWKDSVDISAYVEAQHDY